MEKGKKRERNVNFTREETEKLVSLVESRKRIIEKKKSDAVTWQDKEKAWKGIETEFNSSGGEAFRDAKHLKLKYEALKRDTRKKSSIIRAERYKTGGGTSEASPLTSTEQKIQEIILLPVEGGESLYDSDQIGKPKEKSPFDKLAEAKLDIAALQKHLIEEELEEIVLKKQILKEELEHKKELYNLQKQEMYLKIDILKAELDNKKKES